MIRSTLRFWPWWFAGGIALALTVVAGSLTPGDSLAPPLPSDKLVHCLSYFVLMTWFGGLYRRAGHWRVALALSLLGVAMEGLQLLGGARHGDVADVLANTVGVGLGLIPGALIPGGWCRYAEYLFSR